MVEPTKGRGKVIGKNFGVSSFRYNEWAADLTEQQTFEQALDVNFFGDEAEKMMGNDKLRGLGDLIHVRKLDTGAYMKVIVREIGKGFVKVAPIEAYMPKDVVVPEGSPLTTRWNVGRRAHDVLRKSDNAVMSSGHQSKESALAWIDDHLKAMAA